jgi:hypothetical protein
MNSTEFNEKYKDHIEDRFTGLEFDDPDVTEYLDSEFENHIEQYPEFEFAQIKVKFGMARVYTNAPFGQDREWEINIDKLLNKMKK